MCYTKRPWNDAGYALAAAIQAQDVARVNELIQENKEEIKHNPYSPHVLMTHNPADGQFHAHVAAAADNLEAIQIIVKICPSCFLYSDNLGRSAFDVAGEHGSVKVLNYFLAPTAWIPWGFGKAPFSNPLLAAAANGHVEAVKVLQRFGLDTPDTDTGASPIHIAAARGHLEVVRYLLDSGVSVNQEDAQGRTPLHLATEKEHPAMIELLTTRGAAESWCSIL